ncbi:MAG: class I SAM-dependent methyltransferase [Candidatus Omnitrophota bacterium]
MSNNIEAWETKVYARGKQINKYTWGEVYYYTNRYLLPQLDLRKRVNILELGSGTGNNLSYFAGLGFNVYGIEASETACSIAREILAKFENVESRVICGDFCEERLPFEDNFFDLALDRGSLTHNLSPRIKNALSESRRMLKPQGLLFSIHFFSERDSRFGRGTEVEKGTFKDIGGHTFEDVPQVHFSNLEQIREFYADFKLEFVEERLVKRFYPYENEEAASFDIIARKP